MGKMIKIVYDPAIMGHIVGDNPVDFVDNPGITLWILSKAAVDCNFVNLVPDNKEFLRLQLNT
ncbi:hypothetical protein [Sporomusa termitida]|uniref:hypothetical protein n=1 Tax=Sporomusa termitida TaxID=2377 RepID=UPI001478AB2D|nr:hypothetical protein [Sporomusa termitida]